MFTYEIENIAQQKINSLRDEADVERLVQKEITKKSNNRPRIFGTALAFLLLVSWVAQNLLFGSN
jgi:hypothetical protein